VSEARWPEAGPRATAQVSTLATHTCAIDAAGVLYCWGDNTCGQLGVGFGGQPFADGTGAKVSTPTVVDIAHTYRRVSAGINATCAIRVDGALYCWGDNGGGMLLDGTTENRAEPVRIGTESDWESIAVGWRVACGVRDGGKLFCWRKDAPKAVLFGGPAVREVSLHYYDGLALDALGQSYLADIEAPTLAFNYAASLPTAAHVAAPIFGALAIDELGRVVHWTRSRGVESTPAGTRFVAVSGSYDIVAVAADGMLHFQGRGADQGTPLLLRPLPALGGGWVDAKVAADRTVCGAKGNGSVWCFAISGQSDVGAPTEMVRGH
jgi:alpha-tubulin suppressor-like RCC1 family protein